MKLAAFLLILMIGEISWAQINSSSNSSSAKTCTGVAAGSEETYTVQGSTPGQALALREQIRVMHPSVLPNRIVFVPHWKYLDNARIFHLHVPTGYASVMFTHLPSRTVFVDNDRYLGEEWLAHWIAHELGHLAKNSSKEEDAEKAAREFRMRLRDSRSKNLP